MKTAHYFKTHGAALVIISADLSPRGDRHTVANKREARALAKQAGAVCWNF